MSDYCFPSAIIPLSLNYFICCLPYSLKPRENKVIGFRTPEASKNNLSDNDALTKIYLDIEIPCDEIVTATFLKKITFSTFEEDEGIISSYIHEDSEPSSELEIDTKPIIDEKIMPVPWSRVLVTKYQAKRMFHVMANPSDRDYALMINNKTNVQANGVIKLVWGEGTA